MLDLVPYRGREGSAVAGGAGWALGHASAEAAGIGRAREQPAFSPALGLWISADARLDNRDELRSCLVPSSPDPSDAQLLLLGYARWGVDLAAKLTGDFAFVIWDDRRRALYAARDPFGAKPLFYGRSRSLFAVASEVKQILALEGIARDLEEGLILEYLCGVYWSSGNTFFRGVKRLPPGHWLLLSGGRSSLTRYFVPPPEPLSFPTIEASDREFRRRLERSVGAKLEAEETVLAELSGGLDSSSIVCLGDAIVRRDRRRPALRAISAVFPGFECDETAFIESVRRRVAIDCERYDGMSDEAVPGYRFEVSHPWRRIQPGRAEAIYAIASRERSRVILSGIGADELLFERGVFRDLARERRWVALLRETLRPAYSSRGRRFWFQDALRGLAPEPARRVYRWLEPRLPRKRIAWHGQRLLDLGAELRRAREAPCSRACISSTQRCTWERITLPPLMWTLEVEELELAQHGLEKRYPYLDKALVELVLSLPYEHRLPSGRMKVLLRRSLADLLPPEIAERRRVTTFNSALFASLDRHLPLLREACFGDDRWESAPYVRRSVVQAMLVRMAQEGSRALGWKDAHDLWRISMLELWLRRVKTERSTFQLDAVLHGTRERRPAASHAP